MLLYTNINNHSGRAKHCSHMCRREMLLAWPLQPGCSQSPGLVGFAFRDCSPWAVPFAGQDLGAG